jgi:hypothetical protein
MKCTLDPARDEILVAGLAALPVSSRDDVGISSK